MFSKFCHVKVVAQYASLLLLLSPRIRDANTPLCTLLSVTQRLINLDPDDDEFVNTLGTWIRKLQSVKASGPDTPRAQWIPRLGQTLLERGYIEEDGELFRLLRDTSWHEQWYRLFHAEKRAFYEHFRSKKVTDDEAIRIRLRNAETDWKSKKGALELAQAELTRANDTLDMAQQNASVHQVDLAKSTEDLLRDDAIALMQERNTKDDNFRKSTKEFKFLVYLHDINNGIFPRLHTVDPKDYPPLCLTMVCKNIEVHTFLNMCHFCREYFDAIRSEWGEHHISLCYKCEV